MCTIINNQCIINHSIIVKVGYFLTILFDVMFRESKLSYLTEYVTASYYAMTNHVWMLLIRLRGNEHWDGMHCIWAWELSSKTIWEHCYHTYCVPSIDYQKLLVIVWWCDSMFDCFYIIIMWVFWNLIGKLIRGVWNIYQS